MQGTHEERFGDNGARILHPFELSRTEMHLGGIAPVHAISDKEAGESAMLPEAGECSSGSERRVP